MGLTKWAFFDTMMLFFAEVAELAYALVSEASGATLESSNLSFRTNSSSSIVYRVPSCIFCLITLKI